MNASVAGRELKRALRGYFVALGAPVTVESLASRPWASITFSGERHRLILCLPGPGARAAAETFLDGLGERDFTLGVTSSRTSRRPAWSATLTARSA
jgi:hypothetical protein